LHEPEADWLLAALFRTAEAGTLPAGVQPSTLAQLKEAGMLAELPEEPDRLVLTETAKALLVLFCQLGRDMLCRETPRYNASAHMLLWRGKE
jgi:hypothetical protein